jgi:prophage regulatory protein
MLQLAETGYLRLHDVIGNRRKGIPALFPVSASTWWKGVRSGKFPKPVKLGPRTPPGCQRTALYSLGLLSALSTGGD